MEEGQTWAPGEAGAGCGAGCCAGLLWPAMMRLLDAASAAGLLPLAAFVAFKCEFIRAPKHMARCAHYQVLHTLAAARRFPGRDGATWLDMRSELGRQ